VSLERLLSKLIPALERARIPYMVTGSVASSAHGIPRSTLDLDIVIAPLPAQLSALIKDLPSDSYYADEQQALQALTSKSQFNIIDFETGWKIDFIIVQDSEYGRTAFARRLLLDLAETRVSVAAPEDVILAKLQWAKLGQSDRQLRDVAGIVSTQRERLDITYIDRWVSQLNLERQWKAVQEGQF
jgi:hypothetical protein